MTLSKRGDYVVRSALALARAWPAGEARKIREVVAEMGVPQTFASQILADLVKAGLAISKAGKGGGYRLSRPPEEIPLLDVVEAGEGPLRSERCALGDGPCRWDAVCPLHQTWGAATNALRQVLGATTLADLAQRDVEIEQGISPLPADSHRHGGTSIDVADWVYVESGIDTVVRRFGDAHRLTPAIEAAYHEADALRATLRPDAPAWSPVQAVATCGARPARTPPGAPLAEASQAFAVSWEAVSTNGATSHAEIDLEISPVDPARSKVRLQGRLRPPVHANEVYPDNEILSRLAQVIGRSLLRRLARQLEAPMVGSRPPEPPTRRPPAKSSTGQNQAVKDTAPGGP